jgi:tRNA(Ile)-lysidine synthase
MATSNRLKPDKLLRAVADALAVAAPASLAVAYSGGRDSTVLLHVLKQLRPNLSAVHVHHGLSAHADTWAAHCQATCEAWQIPLSIVKVHTDRSAQTSLEEQARQARYTAFAALPHSHLALAHHAQDQVETYFLQLFRGAAEAGLSGMPVSRALTPNLQLWRPMLAISAEQIAAYCEAYQLQHIEDESNHNTRFKRNALRHDIIPLIEQHFEGAATAILRSVSLQQDAAQRIAALTHLVLNQQAAKLPLSLLRSQPKAANDLLRAWLAQHTQRSPSASQLSEWTRQLCLPHNPERHTRFNHEGQWFRIKHDHLLHEEVIE